MCKIDERIVVPNFAALRAAVFPLSAKNLRGGADIRPPPSVRGLMDAIRFNAKSCFEQKEWHGAWVTAHRPPFKKIKQ